MIPDEKSLESRYPWKYRRAVVLWVIGLCTFVISWLTLKGTDTRLNETLALGAFLLLGSTVGSYVFGAVWHDRGLMDAAARTGYPPFRERRQRRKPPTKLDNRMPDAEPGGGDGDGEDAEDTER